MASLEEDFIDMDLHSSSSSSSSPKTRDFEFKMPSQPTITSPADELFYKGKILPLLLSPRRLMFENLQLPSAAPELFEEEEEDCCSFTPLDSCNVSPSESCRASCEMNPEDFLEWTNELSSFVNSNQTKKPWWKNSKTVKLIKHFIAGKKMKSWFSKSEIPVSAEEENGESEISEGVYRNRGFGQTGKVANCSTLATMINNLEKDGNAEESNTNLNPNLNPPRRSFSGAIKRIPASAKSLSSSSSSCSTSSSGNSNEQQFLRRSTSATDIEGSIEAAIAHCKMSQFVADCEMRSSSL